MMRTEVLRAEGDALPEAAARAGKLLRAGQLVAIPTETVYGLAANALDETAVRAIYAAKGRPGDNPLIVHIADPGELPSLAAEVPDAARARAKAFWPGPLTMILPKLPVVPDATSGGLPTVAIRLPAHPAARAVIRAAGVPLAAPSANLSGSPSPTTAGHVLHDLDGRIPLILDGGPCAVGVESTVITLCDGAPRILRPGGVSPEQLRAVLGRVDIDPAVEHILAEGQRAASPGMKYRHYAPQTRLVLVHGAPEAFAQMLARERQSGIFAGALCLAGDGALLPKDAPRIVYGSPGDADSQARGLFSALRGADTLGAQVVYVRCDAPCNEGAQGVWLAVRNRLLRAAGFSERTL